MKIEKILQHCRIDKPRHFKAGAATSLPSALRSPRMPTK